MGSPSPAQTEEGSNSSLHQTKCNKKILREKFREYAGGRARVGGELQLGSVPAAPDVSVYCVPSAGAAFTPARRSVAQRPWHAYTG